jgi:hypothetical protein
MSLNWDIRKVKNSDEYCFHEDDEGNSRLSNLTNALIWATITVRLGTITDKNWEEFWTRLHMTELVYGCTLRNVDGTEHHITPEEVKAHIGLSCNVCDESKQKFHTAMARGLRDKAQRWRRHWEKEEEKVGEEDSAAAGGAEASAG